MPNSTEANFHRLHSKFPIQLAVKIKSQAMENFLSSANLIQFTRCNSVEIFFFKLECKLTLILQQESVGERNLRVEENESYEKSDAYFAISFSSMEREILPFTKNIIAFNNGNCI
jgi:hypothetical protein